MVRKHYRWTKEKARYRRRRPKTPAPKHGWLLAELADPADTPASTVRYYVQQSLLRPIERRGTATRYERREFLRLLAFLRLKSDDTATMASFRSDPTEGSAGIGAWGRARCAGSTFGIVEVRRSSIGNGSRSYPGWNSCCALTRRRQRESWLNGSLSNTWDEGGG